jgi:hypothetical protein
MHIVDLCLHKLRRVERSTKAAETLAGSEGCDRAFYCRAVAEWLDVTLLKGMLLVLDNSSLYADVRTTRAPKEKRLKVGLDFAKFLKVASLIVSYGPKRRTKWLMHFKKR